MGRGTFLADRFAISRSPTIHPGDVQIVEAVGELPSAVASRTRTIKNAVVFSSQGARPLPNMLGEGDLDGDLSLLIGYPKLLPSQAHPPANYPCTTPKKLGRPSSKKDIAEFFMDYISSDLVGTISNRYLQISDQSSQGIFDERCLTLAKIHSVGVNFAKTGVPVVEQLPTAPSKLKPDFLCPEWGTRQNAHNLGISTSADDEFYQSSKTLGQLYRAIPSPQLHHPLPQISQDTLSGSTLFKDFLDNLRQVFHIDPPNPKPLNDFSLHLLPWFQRTIHQIGSNFSLSRRKGHQLSEEEVFSGPISLVTKSNQTKQQAITKLHETTRLVFEAMRSEIRGEARQERTNWEGFGPP